jgi:two-component system, OmpR family, phosphate regulon response regulator OmpR
MHAKSHILVVDDDRRLRELLKRYLAQNDFLVSTTADAAEARALLKNMSFDAAVLDVMMPGEDGFNLSRGLRQEYPSLPVLLLTAKDAPTDRIQGLEAGADDYLTKPFEPRELVLRLLAILRRSKSADNIPAAPMPQQVLFGNYRFDIARQELRQDDGIVYLTTAEAALLRQLAQNAHLPCSREDLVRACHIEGGERAVDVQVTRLRRKIEIDPGFPRYLQTVRGRGYVLRPEEVIADAP